MSVVNAGRVELDVVAIARDQVTATMREVNKSLEATKRKADEAAGGTKGLREGVLSMTSGVKESIKPMNALREGFEQVRSNGLFVVSVVGAVSGALVGLVAKLTESSSATEELTKRAKEFEGGGNAMQKGIEAIKQKLGIAKDSFQEVYDAAITGAGAAFDELATTQAAIAENNVEAVDIFVRMQREQEKLTKEGASQSRLASERRSAEFAIQAVLDKNIPLVTRIRELSASTAEFERLKLDYLKQQSDEMFRQLSPAYSLFTYIRGFKPGESKPPPGAPPRGGAGGRSPARRDNEMAFLLAEDFENRERVRKEREASEEKMREAEAAVDEIREARRGPSTRELRLQHLEAEKQRVDELAESYRRFADGVRDAFESALPGLGGATDKLAELAIQMGAVDDANKRAALGAGGTISAIMDVAAANAETAQEAFVYKGAGEVAAGLGSLAIGDVKGAGLHFASAAAYGVAAAAAGGGGGGSGRGIGSGGGGGNGPSRLDTDASARGDSGTVVNNIYVAPGTDPQSVARELRRIEHSARGTGRRANAGV